MGNSTSKIFFKKRDGTEAPLTIDNDLKSVFDRAKERNKRNWDYLAIVAGLPGSGKSTFVNNTCAPYCCPWFSEKYICFSADEFIRVTSNCKEYSAVTLDESFASLNSRLMFNPDFLRIINHLQIIRQKRLFIFICLPNFFDLAKNIAIFRASHLFVPYEDEGGKRGNFLAFGRKEKRELYVKGLKFMDYQAARANFHGRFFHNSLVISEEVYEEKKKTHLLAQNKKLAPKEKRKEDLAIPVYRLWKEKDIKQEELGKIFNKSKRWVEVLVARAKDLTESQRQTIV